MVWPRHRESVGLVGFRQQPHRQLEIGIMDKEEAHIHLMRQVQGHPKRQLIAKVEHRHQRHGRHIAPHPAAVGTRLPPAERKPLQQNEIDNDDTHREEAPPDVELGQVCEDFSGIGEHPEGNLQQIRRSQDGPGKKEKQHPPQSEPLRTHHHHGVEKEENHAQQARDAMRR